MGATGKDRNIRPTGQFHQLQAVGDRVIKADVAGSRDQSENVEGLRLAEDHQDSRCLVLAGIGEDDQLAGHAATLPGAPPSSQA
ncbi:hypothetical protein D3C72_2309040 [compost metagenome]